MTRWCCAAVAAVALVLLLAGCGSDDTDGVRAPTTSEAVSTPASATTPPTTTAPGPTTVPLVSVEPSAERAGPATTGSPGPVPGQPDPGAPPTSAPAVDPAPAVPSGDRPDPIPVPSLPPEFGPIPEDIDEIIGSLPTVAPPEGEGTAIRATISPAADLSPGDVVTIEASNLPPGQFMAWAQCNEAGKDAFDIGTLLASCGPPGLGIASQDGTANESVTVRTSVGGTDCTVEACYVGIVVLPGTEDFRRYEPITFAG